jgi:hypothetical protein
MTTPTLYATLEHNGKTLTAEEFLALAEQNGAILTPEETEKCRQDTANFFSRYDVSYDSLFNEWDVVDTHSFGYRFVQFCFGMFLLLLSAFLLFVLFF